MRNYNYDKGTKTYRTSSYESLMKRKQTKDGRIYGRWNLRKIAITFGFSMLVIYFGSIHSVNNARTPAEDNYSTTEYFDKLDENVNEEMPTPAEGSSLRTGDGNKMLDENDSNPRVILIPGCSGSTTVNNFLYQVLRDHGVPIHDFRYRPEKMYFANFEMLTERNIPSHISEEVNEKYKSLGVVRPDPKEKMIEELSRLKEDLAQQNEDLMVKTGTRDMDYISAFQDKFDALFTSIYRSNTLDTLICFIKDCYSWEVMKDLGYMVFEDGTKADLCDESKKDELKSLKLRVHLEPNILIDHIDKLELQSQERIDISTPLVYPSKPQKSEDLFAYQYTSDEDTFQISLNAWTMVLQSLVKTVHKDILEKRMRPVQNKRSQTKHSDEIENYLEVYSALERVGKLHLLYPL